MFKNIHFYKFEKPFSLLRYELEAALVTLEARSCGSMEFSCDGWVSPQGLGSVRLVDLINDKLLFCLRHEEKIIPASTVKRLVDEKVFQVEKEQGRPVGRKEKTDIKDLIIQDLLPRALIKTSNTLAYIDPKNSWLIVNAPTSKKAEEVVSLLRKTLGSLCVVLPQTTISPELSMTRFVGNNSHITGGFKIEDEAELRTLGDTSSIIKCKNVDLLSNEVLAHIHAGKLVHRLALNWQDRISFLLHDDLSIHRLWFNDELIEIDDACGDDIAQFDADFLIMSSELEGFIPALLNALSHE